MCQLQIWGPTRSRTLRWDPSKLQERDPRTLATFAKADGLLKEAFAQSKSTREANALLPRMAASGRWVA